MVDMSVYIFINFSSIRQLIQIYYEIDDKIIIKPVPKRKDPKPIIPDKIIRESKDFKPDDPINNKNNVIIPITEKIPKESIIETIIINNVKYYVVNKKILKKKKKTKIITVNQFTQFTPTLKGATLELTAKRTTGVFTGLEERGIIKKPLIKVARNGKTKQGIKAKVKQYDRRIPRTFSGKPLSQNIKILKKYKLLSRKIK